MTFFAQQNYYVEHFTILRQDKKTAQQQVLKIATEKLQRKEMCFHSI